MSSLNHQQFQLFDPGPVVNAPEEAPKGRSAAVAAVRDVGNHRGDWQDRYPPVGLRGSIPERVALAGRLDKSEKLHDRWRSMGERGMDEGSDDVTGASSWNDLSRPVGEGDAKRPRHPRTDLPVIGPITTHAGGIGFSEPSGKIPGDFGYWDSTRSAWAKHARTEYVPTPLLETHQGEVASSRVHDAIFRPETRDSRSVRGLRPELPRVYHDPGRGHEGRDAYRIVDGNHRLSADLLQGKLFSEAHVLSANDIGPVSRQNDRIRFARHDAEQKAKDMGREAFVEERHERLWDGLS